MRCHCRFRDRRSNDRAKYRELQLADYGISGIPVFQISSLMSRALDKGQRVEVIIDFLPAFSDDVLNGYIKDRSITTTDNRSLNEMLNGLFKQ